MCASCRNEGMADDYASAVAALDDLVSQTPRGKRDGSAWAESFAALRACARALHLPERYADLHVVHVAGTKGKGSVCAMVESILRCTGRRTGMYTSPHLLDVRERIRIDGKPVSEAQFAKRFWHCWHTIRDAAPEGGVPALFRFLTLMALHTFAEERVDATVLEVGLGGRLDATNIVPAPTVCGIAAIGFDHMELLGNTLSAIATEKAGIMKPGVSAYTVPQEEEAMEALKRVADAVQAPLHLAKPLESYLRDPEVGGGSFRDVPIGLQGNHQRVNASLAVSLCHAWEERCGGTTPISKRRCELLAAGVLPREYEEGLRQASWPGRSQVVQVNENITYYLDGAHTAESMDACAQWFADATSQAQAPEQAHVYERWMVFYCKKDRDPARLLLPLATRFRAREIDVRRALFVAPDSSVTTLTTHAGRNKSSTTNWERHLQATWETLHKDHSSPPPPKVPWPVEDPHNTNHSAVVPSVAKAMEWIRNYPLKERPKTHLQILVTGSLYLVGDALRVLRRGRPL